MPLALAEGSAAALRAHGYEQRVAHLGRCRTRCAPRKVQLIAEFFARIYGTAPAKSSILLAR